MAKKASKQAVTAMPTVDREWMAKNDLDMLRRAGEVMQDKSRMKAAQDCAKKEIAGMQKIMGKSGMGLGFAKK